MKQDDHPVSQNASRVVFACFIGFVVLALQDAMREHGRRPTWFWVAGSVLVLLTCCAVAAYFRPRGLPAFIVSTAYVGLFVVGGAFIAESKIRGYSGRLAAAVAALTIVAWLVLGIRRALAAHRDAEHFD